MGAVTASRMAAQVATQSLVRHHGPASADQAQPVRGGWPITPQGTLAPGSLSGAPPHIHTDFGAQPKPTCPAHAAPRSIVWGLSLASGLHPKLPRDTPQCLRRPRYSWERQAWVTREEACALWSPRAKGCPMPGWATASPVQTTHGGHSPAHKSVEG